MSPFLVDLSLVMQVGTTAGQVESTPSFIAGVQNGALLGFAATLLAAFGVWLLNKCSRRKSIRKAVIAELENQENEVNRIIDSLGSDGPIGAESGKEKYEVDPSDLPPAGSIPTTVFHSNAVNLGELPNDEVEKIVEYYSTLNKQIAIIEAIRSSEKVLFADKRSLHKEMPDVGSDREELISKLSSNSICGWKWNGNS